MSKRIGFVSTRIAGTDGVSLETYKWVQVLERNGYQCFFLAGELETPPDRSLVEELAHFNHPEVLDLHRRLFGHGRRRPPELTRRLHELRRHLKEVLYEFQGRFDLDLIIPENVLAIPMHVPLGMALTEFLAETELPAVAHHHDFSWERSRFIINCVGDYLQYAFPPALRNIYHVVINSRASRQLSFRRGLSNVVIPNVLDFTSPPPRDPARREALRRELGYEEGEVMVLQPTRVVPRKRIELAVELVAKLGLSKPWLVISHESGDEGDLYRRRVSAYAREQGVRLIFLGHRVGSIRSFGANHSRPYTIDDVYQAADLVTYPSNYEGFGNAFVEAIYFRKPVVVNRYAIYVEDIEPKGFDVIPFEDFITDEVVAQVKDMLRPERTARAAEANYQRGRRYFSYEVLEQKLLPLVEGGGPCRA